jgi:hypothetical protein
MTEDSFRVKRTVPRYPFIAEVEVDELNNGSRLLARISDLSVRGCYVDTLNPFPLHTEVRLRVRHGNQACELPGTIIYVHSGYGMGILFGSASSPQLAILKNWLTELATTKR